MHLDLLIHNGTVITVNDRFDILKNGRVGIAAGRIILVADTPGADLPPADAYLDAAGGIVMPGLVNTHTHLPMTLFRGLADDLPLMEWLREHIFPAEARHVTPDNVSWAARLGCAELLLSGTTTCCDGYFLEDRVAEAVAAAGLRAVLGQGVIDHPAPGVPDPARNLDTATTFCDRWQDAHPLIRPSIFCHSPYTCSTATLTAAKRAAADRGVLFQIHAAETRAEVDQIRRAHAKSPIAHLSDLGLLDSRTLLVHAIWVDAADIETIAASGAGVSVTTESEMKLASGIAPVPAFLAAGVAVGLGTDGCASNNDQDMLQEMDLTAKLHKNHTGDPTILNAPAVIRLATRLGARAIGLEERIGSVETGKAADLIVLDTRRPHLTPMYHPASQVVYAASGADVRHVLVDGELRVRDGRLTGLDLEEILARINRIAGTIRNGGADEKKTRDQGLQGVSIGSGRRTGPSC